MIRRFVLALLLSISTSASQGAKQSPPPAGPPREFRLPASSTMRFANGMRFTSALYGEVPKVAVQIAILTGTIDEGVGDISLSAVTADMLMEGTASRTAIQISQQAAEMGGGVSVHAGASVTTIGGEVLSENAARFIALLADIVRNPKFDEGDLNRILDKHARDNAIALASPQSQVRKKFFEVFYGNHPFSHTFPPETMLRGFTVQRVRDFHAKNFGANRSHIYVSGLFDAKAIEQAVHAAFENWADGAPPTLNVPATPAGRRVVLVDRPKSEQSSVWLGLPVADPSSADWIRMQVTDYLLGGAFGSRITANIREDKGYSYSPYSFFSMEKKHALWIEAADITTADTGRAIVEIMKEIDRLRNEAAPESELKGIEASLAGGFIIHSSSRGGVIGQLEFLDQHELESAYLSTYVNNVVAVSSGDVRATAQKYLIPEKLYIVVVGDRKIVEPQLQLIPFK